MAKGRRLTLDYVKNFIELAGYKLLSDEYTDMRSKIKIKCNKNHIFDVRFSNFNQGSRCPICYNNHNRKNNNGKLFSYNKVRGIIENKGYTLLSKEYVNSKSKLHILCPNGHEWDVSLGNFKRHSCPSCLNKISNGEIEVRKYVTSLNSNIVCNERGIVISPLTGHGLELDIWIPSINKAIEYNGIYWHSFHDQKMRDNIKLIECRKLGIDLLIIGDSNWINDKDNQKSIIRDFING